LSRLGPPDLLLNNAALINGNAPLWRIPADEFGRVVDVNLKGVANVLRAFVPAMIEGQGGVIVNFSSGWGRSTAPEVAPYCATKWAIEGLTRALAQELPSGMAAVPLNPGIIDTEMLRSTFGGRAEHFPSPEAWAEIAVPFLLALGAKDNGKPLTVPGH
jgi:NAD(P)-dependent dehydrogenase (short-subunit alcohol dehydrogenase family)